MRWKVAGRGRSKSFLTRRPADSYRAELVRATRRGLEFDPATGEPGVNWAMTGVPLTSARTAAVTRPAICPAQPVER